MIGLSPLVPTGLAVAAVTIADILRWYDSAMEGLR
jgi:hypothetical protein